MGKVLGSAPSVSFAKGGTGKMFGKQHAGQQEAGMTSHSVSGGEKKFAEGGKTKMFGKGHASPAEGGATAKKSQ